MLFSSCVCNRGRTILSVLSAAFAYVLAQGTASSNENKQFKVPDSAHLPCTILRRRNGVVREVCTSTCDSSSSKVTTVHKHSVHSLRNKVQLRWESVTVVAR